MTFLENDVMKLPNTIKGTIIRLVNLLIGNWSFAKENLYNNVHIFTGKCPRSEIKKQNERENIEKEMFSMEPDDILIGSH